MKKILAVLLALTMLAALGSVCALAEGEEDVIWGSYRLVDMEDGSERTEDEEAMMAMVGALITMELGEDGHAVLDIMCEEQEAWFDFDAGTFGLEESDRTLMPFTYENGILSFGDGEMTMSFSKDGAASSAAGAFEYYELEELTDETGAPVEMDEPGCLYLFEDGSGILDLYGVEGEVTLDFDAMTVDANGETGTFTLEDGVLTIVDEDGWTGRLRRADPGFAGPYVVTGMITSEGDMSADLASMAAIGILPTLTIGEDGSGVMELYGTQTEVSFDFDAMTVTGVTDNEDEQTPFTYENGEITIESGGTTLTFGRVLAEAAVEAAE